MTGSGTRNIVYVLDISSSMVTSVVNRLDRAKREVREAMATLQPGETFDIVAFFADVKVYRGAQVPATPENIAAASAWVDALDVEGGTNLERAMISALARPRVNVVVVITDGVPTQGQTNWKKLTRQIRQANRNRARIFTVGLTGKDPWGKDRTFEAGRLLDQISRDSNGQFRAFGLR